MLSLFLTLFFTIAISAAPSPWSDKDKVDGVSKRDGSPSLGELTSFFGYDGCDNDKTTTITKAQNDANYIAGRAINYPPIDWGNSPAAIDYFGPPDETAKGNTRQHIIDQLTGAAHSYPGTGFTDYFKDRYVKLKCADKTDLECNNAAAYFRSQAEGDEYPTIIFCPGFFGPSRPSLDDAKQKIKDHPELKAWASALQSQALTFMHELFHIDFGAAQISKPPARDQPMLIGPPGNKERTKAYKPGRAKLLVLSKEHGPTSASQNNDNLAYYAAAAYMTSLYDNTYPAKPRAWNPQLSIEENRKNEEMPQFGILDDLEGSDVSGSDADNATAIDFTTEALFSADAYPQEYINTYGYPIDRPVFSGTATPVAETTGVVTAGGPSSTG